MIISSVEGPKLIGKSTLLEKLYEHDKTVITHSTKPDEQYKMRKQEWKYNDFLTVDRLIEDAGNDFTYYYDRGILTNIIFSVLGDNFGHIKENKIKGTLTVNMFNLSHLESLVKHTNHYIVLYASNSAIELLASRKAARDKREGRDTANEFEINSLKDQNDLYRAYGRILKRKFPDRVVLYEVTEEDVVNNVDYAQNIVNEVNGIKSSTIVPQEHVARAEDSTKDANNDK